jgi:hypothetical protein
MAKSLGNGRIADLLGRMGERAMSIDESTDDGSGPMFRRVTPAWRSDELSRLFRGLDEKCKGNSKHIQRKIVEQIRQTEPILGLPLECYSHSWLSENSV